MGALRGKRLKGRNFKREVVEFGACVWYLQPKSVGVDKLNTRWDRGVWLWIIEESGEVLMGTEKGVIKVITIRRCAGALRWDKVLFDKVVGVPWQPVPGRDIREPPIKICVRSAKSTETAPPPHLILRDRGIGNTLTARTCISTGYSLGPRGRKLHLGQGQQANRFHKLPPNRQRISEFR